MLDPNLTHYEFFLSKPPLNKVDWSEDELLSTAIPELNSCMQGFPSQNFLNFEYQMVNISAAEYQFMLACQANPEQQLTVQEILANGDLDLAGVRSLYTRQLIILGK